MNENKTIPKMKTAEDYHHQQDPETGEYLPGRLSSVRKYDENGKLIEQIEFYKDTAQTRYEYQYDDSGNEVANTIWEYDDDLVFKTTKEYNSQNLLIHEYTDVFSEDENVGYFQFYYRYNSFGQLIEFINDDYGALAVETYEYLFKSNLAIETVFIDGKKAKENIREDLGNRIIEKHLQFDPVSQEITKSEQIILYMEDKKIVRSEESNGKISEYFYNEMGLQIEEKITTPKGHINYLKTTYTFY